MCSVVGCDRRSAQAFKLPEDPERRLEWVQFLFEVNGQRLKESSWTDITICGDHFTEDCFVDRSPSSGMVQLKSSAVPSQFIQPEPQEPEAQVPETQERETREPETQEREIQEPETQEPETHQTVKDTESTESTDDNQNMTGVSEIVAAIDEESDPMCESEESSDEGEVDSDVDWKPRRGLLLKKELRKSRERNRNDADPPLSAKQSELCTECGKFFNKQRHHTCEHKIKPYSCNICGKRCATENALNFHCRIHNENYEHRCKYCHITLKTRVDKQKHEETHLSQEKPYKCSDCSETFSTNKQRKIHLEEHRGPRQLKCHICGIEFLWPLSLQRHLTVHTGERPYKCSVCQRGFNQAGHLKSHMRLHTGERPYKCQHCDKCFNHNVSLKSHIQRDHSASSGCEQKKETIDEKEGDTGDAEGNGSKTGADSEPDNAEEEKNSEEEEKEDIMNRLMQKKKRSTGRPIGRPKSYESGSLVLAVQVEGQCSNSKTKKQQARKSKRTHCSDEETEDEASDSDTSSDSAEEEEEKSRKARKNTARSRGRPKNCDSDSDFDPKERKKKRYSGQISGKSSGKRRGRPRKNLVV